MYGRSYYYISLYYSYINKIEFKDGIAYKWEAEKGKELLDKMLSMDEGAAYLGECALVPFDSPINNSGITFFNTEKGCQLGAYRIYTDNPICFDHPVRVTIRNGDFRVTDPKAPMNPVMFDPKNATFGSVTYYYEW